MECKAVERVCVVVFVCLVAPAAGRDLRADESTSVLRGSVRDPAGAIVPDLKVRAIERTTKTVIETKTDSNGAFEIKSLRPGAYTVEAGGYCFGKYKKEDVQIPVSAEVRLDIDLEFCQGPIYRGPPGERFWTHQERRAKTELEEKLIGEAEGLACSPGPGIHRRLSRLSGDCANKETVDYYFGLVARHSKEPLANLIDSQLGASAEYEAFVQFDEQKKRWAVTLRLWYSHGCGQVCGDGFTITRRVYIDEQMKVLEVVDGDDCDCAWIS